MSVKKKKKKSKLRLRRKSGSRSCKTSPLTDLHEYLYASHHDHSECCMNNDLDSFATEWDPNRIIPGVPL